MTENKKRKKKNRTLTFRLGRRPTWPGPPPDPVVFLICQEEGRQRRALRGEHASPSGHTAPPPLSSLFAWTPLEGPRPFSPSPSSPLSLSRRLQRKPETLAD